MSFRNPLTGPVTIGGTVSVQTPSTPGLVLNQVQPLDLANSSGTITFTTAAAGVGATIGTLTLTPAAGKTAYLVGFDWSARMLAAITAPKIAVAGIAGAPSYQYPNIAQNTTGIGSMTYPQPIPATGAGVAIVITLSYAAAGNGLVAGNTAVINGSAYSL